MSKKWIIVDLVFSGSEIDSNFPSCSVVYFGEEVWDERFNVVIQSLERKSCITIRYKHPPDVSGYAHPPRHRCHADMKNWYSPIMMERFGRGVVMSWRENNIKTEEQGGEREVEDGISKKEVREC
ncbi:hypothetical protein J6590_068809 [Homalodisca vitripennis]|nr:hypothetical protein J6590_068809 [Homalodisca vitripennis]